MRVMVYPIIEIVIGSYVYIICICILPLLNLGLCAYISSSKNTSLDLLSNIILCMDTLSTKYLSSQILIGIYRHNLQVMNKYTQAIWVIGLCCNLREIHKILMFKCI